MITEPRFVLREMRLDDFLEPSLDTVLTDDIPIKVKTVDQDSLIRHMLEITKRRLRGEL